MDVTVSQTWDKTKRYSTLVLTGILSISGFLALQLLEKKFQRVFYAMPYLSLHNLLEFASIMMSFSIFFAAYFTYERTRNVRFLLLGHVYLMVGLLDTFHTLSYLGMPLFLVENTSSNRATTFWIIARLVGAAGMLMALTIRKLHGIFFRKDFLLWTSLISSFALLVAVTYFPGIFPVMFREGTGITRVKIGLEYGVIALLVLLLVTLVRYYNSTGDKSNIQFACALLVAIFSELAFVGYKDRVYGLYNLAGHLYKIVSFFLMFHVLFIRSVKIPYHELAESEKTLMGYSKVLNQQVRAKSRELEDMNQQLQQGLAYAAAIQKSLIPASLPVFPDVGFHARFFPAQGVSGDFYNVFQLDQNRIALYIGDVSGHGFPAATLTVFVHQCIHTLREMNGDELAAMPPSCVIGHLVDFYARYGFREEEAYILLLYAVYDRQTRCLTYASAGLNANPVILKPSGDIQELPVEGFPIINLWKGFSHTYTDSVLELEKGDRLFLFTDGVTEAANGEGVQYTSQRLIKLLRDNFHATCEEQCSAIEDAVFTFYGNKRIKDDITLLAMEAL